MLHILPHLLILLLLVCILSSCHVCRMATIYMIVPATNSLSGTEGVLHSDMFTIRRKAYYKKKMNANGYSACYPPCPGRLGITPGFNYNVSLGIAPTFILSLGVCSFDIVPLYGGRVTSLPFDSQKPWPSYLLARLLTKDKVFPLTR